MKKKKKLLCECGKELEQNSCVASYGQFGNRFTCPDWECRKRYRYYVKAKRLVRQE